MSTDPEPPESPPPSALPVEVAPAAGQSAAQAPSHHGAHGPFHSHCENCGEKLAGPFCHRCGQHDFEFHRSFWHVFLEVLENFFHFDEKLFRNVFALLFRPGRLTADFNAGKRTAQMPPFRLYLFVSVLFFFLLYLDSESPAQPIGDRIKPVLNSTVNGQSASPPEAMHAATQSADEEKPAGAGPAAPAPPERLVDRLRHSAERMQAGAEHAQAAPGQPGIRRSLRDFAHHASDPAHRQELVEHFLHNLPRMLLFCLPLFALYTRFLFRHSGQVYLQHLVLALHFHTFIYLWLMTRDGWVFLAGLPGWGLGLVAHAACNIWMYVYPFIMLRRLFQNSWPLTLLKTLTLLVSYFLTLLLALFVTMVAIFLLL